MQYVTAMQVQAQLEALNIPYLKETVFEDGVCVTQVGLKLCKDEVEVCRLQCY